jgi:hypothetical protein
MSVVRFVRGRPIRARVTSVDVRSTPPIAATQTAWLVRGEKALAQSVPSADAE